MFGTVHAPYDLVWRYIPDNAKDALAYSTHVYTELNIPDDNVRKAIHNCQKIPKNKTLKDILPTELFRKFMKILSKFGKSRTRWLKKYSKLVSISRFHSQDIGINLYKHYEQIKPMWLVNKIIHQWNKFYVKSQFRRIRSLDDYITDEAKKTNAYRGGIEEVRMHCDPLDGLSEEKVKYNIISLDLVNFKKKYLQSLIYAIKSLQKSLKWLTITGYENILNKKS